MFRRRPTLPSGYPLSTMGAGGGHGRVRDGNGWNPSAVTTGTLPRQRTARVRRLPRDRRRGRARRDFAGDGGGRRCAVPAAPAGPGGRSRFRPIRTRPLSVLPRVHSGPINLVIYQGSYLRRGRRPHLGEGFALRCFQRLSRPDTATQRCPWQNSWYTGGRSIPVLSY